MTAYYNEIDPYAAQWLRNLIANGHIADGVVDERSISDVRPDELQEFTQCHFFAGIGIWSYALRQAGWSDDRPVWTGSCPCQPFSGAGTRKGMSDERHLWPHWFHLIQECRPATVFGEQVASKDGLGWVDLVQADMEGADYAIGAFDMCSAGFGAPHIRQRLWFVAYTDDPRSQGWISRGSNSERQDQHRHVGCGGTTDGMAYAESEQGSPDDNRGEPRETGEPQQIKSGGSGSGIVGMGDTDNIGSQGSSQTRVGEEVENTSHEPARAVSDVGVDNAQCDRRDTGRNGDHRQHDGKQSHSAIADGRMGNSEYDGQSSTQEPRSDDQDASDDTQEQIVPVQSEGASVSRDDRSSIRGEGGSATETTPDETNGFWGDADWLLCRDGKWRPVEPCTFPLVNGATARVGRVRAYGNAITAQVSQGLIETYMEV